MFALTSPEIVEQGLIPTKYALGAFGVEGGENLSPPFNWSNPPEGTKSFALTLVDPDVPLEEEWFPYKEQVQVGMLPGDLFIHWIACDIPAATTGIVEGASPGNLPSGAKELASSFAAFGRSGYGGPAPPKGHKAHSYIFTLYALNVDSLNLSPESGYTDFLNAIKGKVLATSSLTTYFGHY
jgi:Raf kinase inhibitor-like YbhB/YbcL family protein